MAISAALSIWEVIKIPLGKRDQVLVDGRSYKPIGWVFTPSIVRRVDELAKHRSFLR
jgi:hypothetical protein